MDRTELYRVSTQILENIINDEKNDNNILFDMDIWDWSQGVALYGIWKYYRLTGERRYLEYLTQWFDTKLNRPIVHNINTMAPLLTLCFLYEETGREEYRDYCESCAEWLLDGLPKTEMGGFQHVTIDSDNNQQLWADTVFMAVLFMGKIASITRIKRQGCGATVGRLSAWTIMQAHFGRVEIAGSPSRRPSCRACWSWRSGRAT